MSETFVPINNQPALDGFIIENPTLDEETTVPMDVLFVGAGPAGLAGAIKLAQLIKDDEKLKTLKLVF